MAEIAASRLRWRNERHWLNQHRSELAKLMVQLYPVEYRVPHAAVLAQPEWLVAEPMELGSLMLQLDEFHALALDKQPPPLARFLAQLPRAFSAA